MLKAPGRRLAAAAALAVGFASLATAALAASEGGSLDLKYEYYQDRNKVWNHTPCFLLKLPLARNWFGGWEQEFDVVTGASRRLGADKVGPFGDRELDAVSGASKIETRHSENPSVTYSNEGTVATASFYSSREQDYFSLSPAVSLAWDFNQRNTTLGVDWAEFFDDFAPRGAFAGLGGKKRIHSFGVTAAQSLTAFTLVGLTADYFKSSGYLGHPYNPPRDMNGAILTEILPDRKQAGALSGQLVQGWLIGNSLGSANLDVRRYQDNWSLKSLTADLKLSQYLTDGLYLRLRGRYYKQTGTFFAKESYTGREPYRVADIRYFPFTSFLVGVKLSGPFPDSWGDSRFLPDRWDIKLDHTLRDTRGDSHAGAVAGSPLAVDHYQSYEPDENYLQDALLAGLHFDL
jgi:hypothetical protein